MQVQTGTVAKPRLNHTPIREARAHRWGTCAPILALGRRDTKPSSPSVRRGAYLVAAPKAGTQNAGWHAPPRHRSTHRPISPSLGPAQTQPPGGEAALGPLVREAKHVPRRCAQQRSPSGVDGSTRLRRVPPSDSSDGRIVCWVESSKPTPRAVWIPNPSIASPQRHNRKRRPRVRNVMPPHAIERTREPPPDSR